MKTSTRLVAGLPALVCLCVARADLANSPWPAYGGGGRNTHLSSYVGPVSAPTVEWSYSLSTYEAVHQPIITEDGGIVVCARRSGERNRVFALNRDGTQRWITTPLFVGNWPAADGAGNVYYGTGD